MTGIGEHVRRLGDPAPFGALSCRRPTRSPRPTVYAEFDRLGLGRDGDELDRLSGQVPGAARDGSLLAERLLHNDLEAPARSLCPPIGDALAAVRASGAVRAMVSGSGPTVVGLFTGRTGPRTRSRGRARCARAIPARVAADAGRPGVRRAPAGLMRPVWLAGAVALALYLVVRRRAHGRVTLVAGALAAAGAALIGSGVIELPNVEHLIEEAGQALGKWTYLAVGVLAFLETGAFIGLVAPGETTVIVGGLVAGQGEISLTVLIAIVWSCAVPGDLTSYTLGRRLGRDFMVRHGARVKITEERLEQVEAFFERRGGVTILIGRFIGLVRAIAPFVAGASRMPLRKFLPYDVLGAGLWATTFCVLGFVFWRSFDQLTSWVSRGLFAFGLVVALIVGHRLPRPAPAQPGAAGAHERAGSRAARQAAAASGRARPARGVAAVVRPAAGVARAPARFVWNRSRPATSAWRSPRCSRSAPSARSPSSCWATCSTSAMLLGDRLAFDIAARLDAGVVRGRGRGAHGARLAPGGRARRRGTTALGVARRRFHEAAVLPVAGSRSRGSPSRSPRRPTTARGRRARSSRRTGRRIPPAHAAYAVVYVACAVVLVRAGSGLAARFAVVTAAIALAVALALTRVYCARATSPTSRAAPAWPPRSSPRSACSRSSSPRLRHNDRPDP